MTEEQKPISDWQHKLKEQMKALRELQIQNQKERIRQANKQTLEWLETQPPEIKDTSIGK